jgi:hypothetical protein
VFFSSVAVTVEEVQKHAVHLLEKVHIRMLIEGNIYKTVGAIQ